MQIRSLVLILPLAMGIGWTVLFADETAQADTGPVSGISEVPALVCSSCHDRPELKMTWTDGQTTSAHVDSAALQQSVHGQLGCENCHSGYSLPHQAVAAKSLFDYRKEAMATCQKCHPSQVDALQASVHAGLEGIGITCQDCHGSHDIRPAQTASLRATTLALCTGCHQDQNLMQKYGLSSAVVTTYLKDFHGRTSLLQAKAGQEAWINEAVCVDCHGVHSIAKVDSANSQVVRENLAATCSKCHQSATPNFPSSWMFHYAPSPTKTPLVFLARTFYWVMIPFTIVGLMIHIGIDVRHRRKQSGARKE